jgi:acyl-CoA thioester hydrolase
LPRRSPSEGGKSDKIAISGFAQFILLNMKEFHQKSCEVKLTVPFHDLDPMHMVWHGNYMKYFEIARIALFDKFNIDLFTYSKETHYLFPIIKTSTKHIISLKHRDKFICKATLVEANYKIIIDFEIRLVENGKVCTKGRSEQVAVKAPEMEMMLRIPDDISKAFGCE